MMKNIKTSILILILLITVKVSAQIFIEPIDATIEFDDAARHCLQVNIDPEPKALKHAWRKYLKDNYDFKLKGIGFFSNKDLLSKEKIVVPEISSKTMDFYTHVMEDENGSVMKVFVRHGYDIYVSKESHPKEYEVIKGILNDFMESYLPKYYKQKVKETKKRVKELSRETKDIKKDIQDDESKIENLKNEIKKLEEDLETKNELLESVKEKLKRNEKLENKGTCKIAVFKS